jgi:hypothetical protein
MYTQNVIDALSDLFAKSFGRTVNATQNAIDATSYLDSNSFG